MGLKFLGKIFSPVGKGVAAAFGKGPWADDLQKVQDILNPALESVKFTAMLSGNFHGVELAEKIQKFTGQKVNVKDLANAQKKNDYLRLVAQAVLSDSLDDLGEVPPDRIINSAIELAFIKFKNEDKQ